MLNYAYAVLIAQTQIRLIVQGYDPTIGIMHEKKALRGINPGFALDHMEPMRPVVDRAVLQLIDTITFTGADFSISARRGLPFEPRACAEGGAGCIGAMPNQHSTVKAVSRRLEPPNPPRFPADAAKSGARRSEQCGTSHNADAPRPCRMTCQ